MKNKSLIIIIAVLVAVIAVAAIVYPKLSEQANENSGNGISAATGSQDKNQNSNNPAISDNNAGNPDIQLQTTDIRVFDKDGNEVCLSDFAGKPIIVNFWANWCGYCLYEMPAFEAAYKKYGDEINFLMINSNDGIEKGGKTVTKNGYTFPVYYDLDYEAHIAYKLHAGLPRTLALDAEGNLIYNRSGMINAEILEQIIRSIK